MADHWVTINGRHVLIGAGHDGSHNPASKTGNDVADQAIERAKGTPVYNRSLDIRHNQMTGSDFGSPLSEYNRQSQREWLGTDPPPSGKITVYRATPSGTPARPGDYVTTSRNYAKLHMRSNLGGSGKIQAIEATLGDIYPADGPKEFWYYPKK